MQWNDLIGQRLGRYEILEELGRGGSSRVYHARIVLEEGQTPQDDVAVKVMPNDAEDRVGFVQRFAREVEAVRKLNHPNIVQVFESGETSEFVYLAMQWVKGGTLRQRLGNPLPASEAALYIQQMALALHHAHKQGIIHRDVKPSNMLVDGDDPQHLLLTDFGTAKIQGARGLTKTGTTIGTPEYMAPEQAEGQEIDQRADIYALGCVLYEELSGRPPFVGSTPVSVLYQHVHSRPSYIRGYNTNVPRELSRILEICLAKRPEDRFGTAEMLADALAPFTDGSAQFTPAPWIPGTPSQPSRPSYPTHPSYPMPSSREETTTGAMWPPLDEAWRTPAGDKLPPVPSTGPAPLTLHLGSDAPMPATHPAVPAAAAQQPPTSGSPAQQLNDTVTPTAVPSSTDDTRLPGAPPKRVQRQTIPLPNFRLPSKTAPVGPGLTADERQELEALFAQIAQERLVPPGGPPSIPPGMRRSSTSGPLERSATSGPLSRGATSGPLARSATSGPLRTSGATPVIGTPVRGAEHSGRIGMHLPPDERALPPVAPRNDDGWGHEPHTPTRTRPRMITFALVALVALVLVGLSGWLALDASGARLGLLGGVQPTRTTHTATATQAAATPTQTHAPQPTDTSTSGPQQNLNQQAFASFRAVTLNTSYNSNCSNGQTHFSGQTVYVNLCTSSSLLNGTMRVQVRQAGQVIDTLIYGKSLQPHAFYYYYHTLAPGSYDMLVTINTASGTGVARDISFTVS